MQHVTVMTMPKRAEGETPQWLTRIMNGYKAGVVKDCKIYGNTVKIFWTKEI